MRRRLIGSLLLFLLLLSLGEPVRAAICAAQMRNHSDMAGMPGMPAHESEQTSQDEPATDCPIEQGIASPCVIGFSLAAARVTLPVSLAHEVVSLRVAALTPLSADLTSIFHPPKP